MIARSAVVRIMLLQGRRCRCCGGALCPVHSATLIDRADRPLAIVCADCIEAVEPVVALSRAIGADT